YVDGVLVASEATGKAWVNDTDTWRIGQEVSSGGGEWWLGSLADVRVYDIALNADEIRKVYLDGVIDDLGRQRSIDGQAPFRRARYN
ncbi:hypothetical protein LCGC14_2257560, partial [marine sediment metagenome]